MMNSLIAGTRLFSSTRANCISCFLTKEVISCLSHHIHIDVSYFLHLLFSFFSLLLCFFSLLLYGCTSFLLPFKSFFYFSNVFDLCFRFGESIFYSCLDSRDGIFPHLSLDAHMLGSLGDSVPITKHRPHCISHTIRLERLEVEFIKKQVNTPDRVLTYWNVSRCIYLMSALSYQVTIGTSIRILRMGLCASRGNAYENVIAINITDIIEIIPSCAIESKLSQRGGKDPSSSVAQQTVAAIASGT